MLSNALRSCNTRYQLQYGPVPPASHHRSSYNTRYKLCTQLRRYDPTVRRTTVLPAAIEVSSGSSRQPLARGVGVVVRTHNKITDATISQ